MSGELFISDLHGVTGGEFAKRVTPGKFVPDRKGKGETFDVSLQLNNKKHPKGQPETVTDGRPVVFENPTFD